MVLEVPTKPDRVPDLKQRDVRETTNTVGYTSGEGIDISAEKVISGEDATTANKGIASFETNDFTVATGAVSLKNKTSYWSCSGIGFTTVNPDTDQVFYGVGTLTPELTLQADGAKAIASVNLPQGAIITGAVVYSNVSTENWALHRVTLSTGGAGGGIAAAALNTEDTTITNATVDNETYGYWMLTDALDDTDEIFGARITYTTDYD